MRIYSIRHLYMLWVVVLPICFYIMAFISFYLFICYAFISLMQSFFLFWQLCLSLPFLACYCGRVSTVWLLYRILCLLALGILSDYPQVIHRLSRSSIFCECESDDNIKDSKPILKAISLIICGHGTWCWWHVILFIRINISLTQSRSRSDHVLLWIFTAWNELLPNLIRHLEGLCLYSCLIYYSYLENTETGLVCANIHVLMPCFWKTLSRWEHCSLV